MESLYPENFARFYDVIYSHHPLGEQNDFYEKEILKSAGTVLEVGVGTGRHFVKALNSGADIYGIDVSHWMLEVLRKKLNEQQEHRISQQNIIDFRFEKSFDLIIAPFRVFQHLLDKQDQLKALNNVHSHLKPGGKFIFDIFVPDLKMLISGLDNFVDFDGEYESGKGLKRTVFTEPDQIHQIINVRFQLEWAETGHVKKENFNTPMRYFFRYEMEHLLERSSFDRYEIKGDFQGGELDNNSREFIIYCIRNS